MPPASVGWLCIVWMRQEFQPLGWNFGLSYSFGKTINNSINYWTEDVLHIKQYIWPPWTSWVQRQVSNLFCHVLHTNCGSARKHHPAYSFHANQNQYFDDARSLPKPRKCITLVLIVSTPFPPGIDPLLLNKRMNFSPWFLMASHSILLRRFLQRWGNARWPTSGLFSPMLFSNTCLGWWVPASQSWSNQGFMDFSAADLNNWSTARLIDLVFIAVKWKQRWWNKGRGEKEEFHS